MTIQRVNFQAKWNTINSHLRPEVPTTAQKVGRVAWNIFSVVIPFIGLARLMGYGIGIAANRLILPAAKFIQPTRVADAKNKFNDFWHGPITLINVLARREFNAEEHTVITPDNAALSVKLIRHRSSDSSTIPTVIYFNGNFQLAMQDPHPWTIQKAIETNTACNFVFFDYRGVGESTGTFNAAQDLVVDGSSIVQWVREYLHTPEDQIHFYGQSLGGAVAVQTQALDPQHLTGRHINERSFASLEKMAKSIFGSGCLGKLLSWVVKNQGHSADAAAAFGKLQGQKLVVYHPHDAVIPSNASLKSEVQDRGILHCLVPKSGSVQVRLPSGEMEMRTYASLSKQRNHNAPLEWHEGAIEGMAQFLFGLPNPQSQNSPS
jgi:pimeloyl-ACP methyl ester carboxylesterase